MFSSKTHPEASKTLEGRLEVIQVEQSNTHQAVEIQKDVTPNEEIDSNLNNSLQNQGRLAYILLQILRWSMIIGFCLGCALFVKDAWEGYQANEASIKVSREKVEYMEHPAVTMW